MLEAVPLEERVHGGDVVVVLVLGGLERLRLDEDRALEPDGVLVLDHHVEEPAELIEFMGHVGVQQRVVALSAAPQHVVLAAELLGCGHAVRDLRRSVFEQLRIGVGRGTRLEPWVREQVRRAPQQAHAGALLMGGGQLHHLVEVAARLGEGRALGRDVAVVEAVERRAELGEELEGDLHLLLRGGHRVAADLQPRPIQGAGAEDVDALGVERVPIGHREAEVVGHGPPGDHAVRVVPAERERVVGLGPFVADRVDVGEEVVAHVEGVLCSFGVTSDHTVSGCLLTSMTNLDLECNR